MNSAKLGRNLLWGLNVATALTGLLADWNRTDALNRRWSPRAKFHDGLTISLGALLGGLGVYALQRKGGDPDENVRLAALCPAMFFGAVASAQACPGADTIETQFADYWPKDSRFSFNEVPFAATMLLLTAVAWKLAEPAIPVHAVPPESDDIVPMPAGA